ncbi:MAG: hypothetical protein NTZ78_14340 [Candidatus Aureabacteria bacterium]|nr:hypothetical protein [Candidatus Auribacterota bacterium]
MMTATDHVSSKGKLDLFLLSLCYGSYFFLLLLLPFDNAHLTRNTLWVIYSVCLLIVIPLAMLSSYAIRGLMRKLFGENRLPHAFLIAFNALCVCSGIWGLRLHAIPPAFVASLFPLASLFAPVAALRAGKGLLREPGRAILFSNTVYFLTPLLFGAALFTFLPFTLPAFRISALIALIATAALFHGPLVQWRGGRLTKRILDGLVILLIALMTFDTYFHFDPPHYNFYTGPVNDLMRGKSLLFDINCQYGLFVVYFLSFLFQTGLIPFSYAGLSCVISILWVAQFLVVYFLLRTSLKSIIFSVVTLSLILMMNYFMSMGYPTNTPSTGPLRFGLPYLLLALAALRVRRPGIRRRTRWIDYATLGIASVWSVETFFFSAATYAGIVMCECCTESSSYRDRARWVGRELIRVGLTVLIAYALVSIDIRLRSGEWPHWRYYGEYLVLYGAVNLLPYSGGVGALPIQPWGAWGIVIAIYFASLIAALYALPAPGRRENARELSIVFGMTTCGIALFTYFIIRPHPNNLYHICLPTIFVAAYWLMRVSQLGLPRTFRFSVAYCSCCAIALLYFAGVPSVTHKWHSTALYSAGRSIAQLRQGKPTILREQLANLESRSPTRQRVAEALYLIQKYAPDKQRVALFIEPDCTTEALMLAGKTNVFPISHPGQDYLLGNARSAMDRGLRYAHHLTRGDYLFMERDIGQLNELQQAIVMRLGREFRFENMETTEHGIVAVKLRSTGPGDIPR